MTRNLPDTDESRMALIRAAGLEDLLGRYGEDLHAAASLVLEMRGRLEGIDPPAPDGWDDGTGGTR